MAWDKLRLARKITPVALSFMVAQLEHYIKALLHRLTYQATAQPRNIVVIGGSFTGLHLAKRLIQTLPSGYRVILVEKNSHFNYTFNFPRYSVLQGHEQKAFIPYDGWVKSAPEGSIEIIHQRVLGMSLDSIQLESGEEIEFEYLAIATGSNQELPAKVEGLTKMEGMSELRDLQEKIENANRIAIVGGGAVGVQLSGDIKSWYPKKDVTLLHSRQQLLPSFGKRLSAFVVDSLEKLGVKILLGERPEVPSNRTSDVDLRLKDGETETFDLVIPCTGLRPNSAFLAQSIPTVISPETGRILVKPTLQISTHSKSHSDALAKNIFALGDVAETQGAKMARAGMEQAEVVQSNIVSLIANKEVKLKEYVPQFLEGSLKLSLGKDASVMYAQDGDEDFVIPFGGLGEDLSVKQIWWHLGARLKNSED